MGTLDDLRYSLRSLMRDPLFTIGAIFALTLSIGATTSVFTVVKSVLIEPLAMKEPDRLVALWSMRADGRQSPFNIPNYLDLHRRNQTLEDTAAYGSWNASLTGEAEPERLLGVRVSGNYFKMTGVSAVAGRTLEAADEAPGSPKVVVITYALWQRRYGGENSIVGRTIRLNSDPYIVVGVLPQSFAFNKAAMEIAVPLVAENDPARAVRSSISFLRVFGRIKPGVTRAQVESDLNRVRQELRQEYPIDNATEAGVQVISLQEEVTGGSNTMLTVLLCSVTLVLLIACANISSLLIVRAARRRKEFSIRSALGGSRWVIARQPLIESVVLCVTGGTLGIILASWGVRLLLSLSPAELPRAREIHLDLTIITAAFALSILCGILSGLIPAFQSMKGDLNEALRADGRTSTEGAVHMNIRGTLVIAEVALSLVLLTGAGLFLESFRQLSANDPGFRTEDIVTFRLSLPSARYKTGEAISAFHDQVIRRIEELPDVKSAGAISILPLSGPFASINFTIDGAPAVAEKDKPGAEYRVIDAKWFSTMNIPLLKGRAFNEHDNAKGRPVVVISEALAKRYWQDRDPIGARLRVEDGSGPGRDAEVIGVTGNVRELSLEKAPTPCLFVPLDQIPQDVVRFMTNNLFIAVKTRPQASAATAIRQQIHTADADVATAEATMAEYMTKALSTRRFSLRLVGVFALAALLLASSGLYALVAYATAMRTREIGVRRALGATSFQVAKLIARQALTLVVIGVVIGIGCSWTISTYLQSMLFNVSPHDPTTLYGGSALMLLVAAIASVLPVLRATRVDPAEALRR